MYMYTGLAHITLKYKCTVMYMYMYMLYMYMHSTSIKLVIEEEKEEKSTFKTIHSNSTLRTGLVGYVHVYMYSFYMYIILYTITCI